MERVILSEIVVDAMYRLRPESDIPVDVFDDYVAAYTKNPDEMPPVDLRQLGNALYLVDGFIRLEAAKEVGLHAIAATIAPVQTADDIALAAAEVNHTHGLRRSNSYKRAQIQAVLMRHPDWSDRRVGAHTGCSHPLVADMRKDLTGKISSERTYVAKSGRESVMNTANIGGKQREPFEDKLEAMQELARSPIDEGFVASAPHDRALEVSPPRIIPEPAPDAPEQKPLRVPVKILKPKGERPTQRVKVRLFKKASDLHKPSEDEEQRFDQLALGQTVVANESRDKWLVEMAREFKCLVSVRRHTDWENPFVLDKDGGRDEVCDAFRDHYLPHKKSLLTRISELAEKVLLCDCYPERCHADELAERANKLSEKGMAEDEKAYLDEDD